MKPESSQDPQRGPRRFAVRALLLLFLALLAVPLVFWGIPAFLGEDLDDGGPPGLPLAPDSGTEAMEAAIDIAKYA